MGNSARLGVLCLMALAIALARLVEVEFRPPAPLTVEAVAPTEPAAPVATEAITVGQAAPVPEVAPEPQQTPDPQRIHVVKRGETLGTISKKVYGTSHKWQQIYEANRDRIPDPRKMRHGVELRIP